MFRFFPEKKKSSQIEEFTFQPELGVPRHIAIIMDGNGRWATNRRLPRFAGHKAGMDNVKKITKHAAKLGVKALTLYTFSTENWKRPEDEVNYLMKLPVDFFDTFVPELIEDNIRVHAMGYLDALPKHTFDAIQRAMAQTAHCTGMVLNFAFNYGSRAEILTAVRHIAKEVQEEKIALEEIDDALFADHLMTSFLPSEYRDPELMIRTSGEERISNFLLWQFAYSEFYFTDTYWPDFDEKALERALASYQMRDRRFGGLNNKEDKK
ncbi:MAG TPA: isoprenyl transferase [Candidatus Enterococcus stercoripullorum]|nr:isoprenyl transferase [Candidatus Enterococcus stercoripullorum]